MGRNSDQKSRPRIPIPIPMHCAAAVWRICDIQFMVRRRSSSSSSALFLLQFLQSLPAKKPPKCPRRLKKWSPLSDDPTWRAQRGRLSQFYLYFASLPNPQPNDDLDTFEFGSLIGPTPIPYFPLTPPICNWGIIDAVVCQEKGRKIEK